MFFFTIGWFVAFVLLLLAVAKAKAKHRTPIIITMGAFFILPSFCVLFSLSITLQVFLVTFVAAIASSRRLPARSFCMTVAAASLASCVVMCIFGFADVRRIQAIAARYPLGSLAPRLEYEKIHQAQRTGSDQPMAPLVLHQRWRSLEDRLAQNHSRRRWALGAIHASAVEHFIRAQSFGVGRMIDLREERFVNAPEEEPIEQPAGMPDDGTPDMLPAGETSEALGDFAARSIPISIQPDALWMTHANNLANFASPDREGLIRDRDHVAGFLPHSITQRHERFENHRAPPPNLRIELVSLLKFDEPRIYVSKYLPGMEELAKAATRPLDAFEQHALSALRQGEDIVSEEQSNKLRAMGALRALKQCLQCHTVQEGELLGAFSYTAWPTPAIRPADESAGAAK